MLKTLTLKQKNVLDFYNKFFAENSVMPTYAQASEVLGTQPSVIYTHISNLEKLGYLNKDGSGKVILEAKLKNIPILGSIACGSPIDVYEEKEGDMEVPLSMIGYNGNGYVLKAKGNSMQAERGGIFDGDYLIIKSQSSIEDGDIAVVIDRSDFEYRATLKQVFQKENGLLLKPKNPAFPETLLHNCEIKGKLVGIIRNFN